MRMLLALMKNILLYYVAESLKISTAHFRRNEVIPFEYRLIESEDNVYYIQSFNILIGQLFFLTHIFYTNVIKQTILFTSGRSVSLKWN